MYTTLNFLEVIEVFAMKDNNKRQSQKTIKVSQLANKMNIEFVKNSNKKEGN